MDLITDAQSLSGGLRRNPWLLRFRPNPAARRRMVCFGPAGGGASFFRTWPDVVPSDTELVAIQLPGREGRYGERPIGDIHALADAIAPLLAALGDAPVVLFGHSMGALVAYESTHRLRAIAPRMPIALAVSGREAPDAVMPDMDFVDLPNSRFFDAVQKRYGGIPAEVLATPELQDLSSNGLRGQMSVPKEHPRVLVATNKADLRDTKACLKEPTDCLMSEVVEPQVLYACTSLQTLPGQPKSVSGQREH